MTDASKITREAIAEMAALTRPHLRRTPMIDVNLADFGGAARPVTLKLEQLQHTGSFKARGAFANLTTRPIPPAGVAAASGGNHGAAVAYAARKLGFPATIFAPSVVSPAKAEMIRGFGAELVIAEGLYAEAQAACVAHVEATGAMPVHAYDQVETVLGQGGVGLEIEQELERAGASLDTLLVAVGGGGLIAGIAGYLGDRVRVVAVEPESAPTLNHALAAGEPVDAPAGGVAADSLAPKRIGGLAFAVARRMGVGSVLVADEAISAAQRVVWERLRLVLEPGGATAFAGLLAGVYQPQKNERIGVLLCGGNTDVVRFG